MATVSVNANGAKPQRRHPGDVVCRRMSDFERFFDSRARKTVRLSGQCALRRIRAGKTGHSLAWTELFLLSTLLKEK